MKKYILIFICISAIAVAQDKKQKRQIQGFYFQPELNIGLNLANIIKEGQDRKNDPYYQYSEHEYPNDFSYGISTVLGYHFFPNFSLGGGLKYNYITDNFHIIYAIVQPKIIINQEDDPFFFDLTYGFKINYAVVEKASFWGLKIGTQFSYSKRLNQQGGIYFESNTLGIDSFPFVGIFYGITIFSNKNYNKYGKD